VLGVEMSRLVLLVVHPDHDAKEDRDYRHAAEYTPPSYGATQPASAVQANTYTPARC
jgi:hypothetical protein